jgi:2-polyprenyl-6-methoxyphenol hydroxylase-like FAD-dependent oxidoreductase
MPTKIVTTGCCIAGGGPAGMMLGDLLARAGVEVMVLEKHSDFFCDFRGDTIHPSTLEIMSELGLLEDFLKLPHQEVRELAGQIGEDRVVLADFSPDQLPERSIRSWVSRNADTLSRCIRRWAEGTFRH